MQTGQMANPFFSVPTPMQMNQQPIQQNMQNGNLAAQNMRNKGTTFAKCGFGGSIVFSNDSIQSKSVSHAHQVYRDVNSKCTLEKSFLVDYGRSKSELEKRIDNMGKAVMNQQAQNPSRESFDLLMVSILLKILWRHDGDISKASPEELCSALKYAYKDSPKQLSIRNYDTLSLNLSPEQTESVMNDITNALLGGLTGKAQDIAENKGLWSIALILASHRGHPMYKDCVARFSTKCAHPESQCRSALLAITDADLFGHGSSDGTRTPIAGDITKHWSQHCAMIISASAPQNQAMVRKHLVQLGDLLMENDKIMPAQCCYIIAGIFPQKMQREAKMCLLGGDHRKKHAVSPMTVHLTELYTRILALRDKSDPESDYWFLNESRFELVQDLCEEGYLDEAKSELEKVVTALSKAQKKYGADTQKRTIGPFAMNFAQAVHCFQLRFKSLVKRSGSSGGFLSSYKSTVKDVKSGKILTKIGRGLDGLIGSVVSGIESDRQSEPSTQQPKRSNENIIVKTTVHRNNFTHNSLVDVVPADITSSTVTFTSPVMKQVPPQQVQRDDSLKQQQQQQQPNQMFVNPNQGQQSVPNNSSQNQQGFFMPPGQNQPPVSSQQGMGQQQQVNQVQQEQHEMTQPQMEVPQMMNPNQPPSTSNASIGNLAPLLMRPTKSASSRRQPIRRKITPAAVDRTTPPPMDSTMGNVSQIPMVSPTGMNIPSQQPQPQPQPQPDFRQQMGIIPQNQQQPIQQSHPSKMQFEHVAMAKKEEQQFMALPRPGGNNVIVNRPRASTKETVGSMHSQMSHISKSPQMKPQQQQQQPKTAAPMFFNPHQPLPSTAQSVTNAPVSNFELPRPGGSTSYSQNLSPFSPPTNQTTTAESGDLSAQMSLSGGVMLVSTDETPVVSPTTGRTVRQPKRFAGVEVLKSPAKTLSEQQQHPITSANQLFGSSNNVNVDVENDIPDDVSVGALSIGTQQFTDIMTDMNDQHLIPTSNMIADFGYGRTSFVKEDGGRSLPTATPNTASALFGSSTMGIDNNNNNQNSTMSLTNDQPQHIQQQQQPPISDAHSLFGNSMSNMGMMNLDGAKSAPTKPIPQPQTTTIKGTSSSAKKGYRGPTKKINISFGGPTKSVTVTPIPSKPYPIQNSQIQQQQVHQQQNQNASSLFGSAPPQNMKNNSNTTAANMFGTLLTAPSNAEKKPKNLISSNASVKSENSAISFTFKRVSSKRSMPPQPTPTPAKNNTVQEQAQQKEVHQQQQQPPMTAQSMFGPPPTTTTTTPARNLPDSIITEGVKEETNAVAPMTPKERLGIRTVPAPPLMNLGDSAIKSVESLKKVEEGIRQLAVSPNSQSRPNDAMAMFGPPPTTTTTLNKNVKMESPKQESSSSTPKSPASAMDIFGFVKNGTSKTILPEVEPVLMSTSDEEVTLVTSQATEDLSTDITSVDEDSMAKSSQQSDLKAEYIQTDTISIANDEKSLPNLDEVDEDNASIITNHNEKVNVVEQEAVISDGVIKEQEPVDDIEVIADKNSAVPKKEDKTGTDEDDVMIDANTCANDSPNDDMVAASDVSELKTDSPLPDENDNDNKRVPLTYAEVAVAGAIESEEKENEKDIAADNETETNKIEEDTDEIEIEVIATSEKSLTPEEILADAMKELNVLKEDDDMILTPMDSTKEMKSDDLTEARSFTSQHSDSALEVGNLPSALLSSTSDDDILVGVAPSVSVVMVDEDDDDDVEEGVFEGSVPKTVVKHDLPIEDSEFEMETANSKEVDVSPIDNITTKSAEVDDEDKNISPPPMMFIPKPTTTIATDSIEIDQQQMNIGGDDKEIHTDDDIIVADKVIPAGENQENQEEEPKSVLPTSSTNTEEQVESDKLQEVVSAPPLFFTPTGDIPTTTETIDIIGNSDNSNDQKEGTNVVVTAPPTFFNPSIMPTSDVSTTTETVEEDQEQTEEHQEPIITTPPTFFNPSIMPTNINDSPTTGTETIDNHQEDEGEKQKDSVVSSPPLFFNPSMPPMIPTGSSSVPKTKKVESTNDEDTNNPKQKAKTAAAKRREERLEKMRKRREEVKAKAKNKSRRSIEPVIERDELENNQQTEDVADKVTTASSSPPPPTIFTPFPPSPSVETPEEATTTATVEEQPKSPAHMMFGQPPTTMPMEQNQPEPIETQQQPKNQQPIRQTVEEQPKSPAHMMFGQPPTSTTSADSSQMFFGSSGQRQEPVEEQPKSPAHMMFGQAPSTVNEPQMFFGAATSHQEEQQPIQQTVEEPKSPAHMMFGQPPTSTTSANSSQMFFGSPSATQQPKQPVDEPKSPAHMMFGQAPATNNTPQMFFGGSVNEAQEQQQQQPEQPIEQEQTIEEQPKSPAHMMFGQTPSTDGGPQMFFGASTGQEQQQPEQAIEQTVEEQPESPAHMMFGQAPAANNTPQMFFGAPTSEEQQSPIQQTVDEPKSPAHMMFGQAPATNNTPQMFFGGSVNEAQEQQQPLNAPMMLGQQPNTNQQDQQSTSQIPMMSMFPTHMTNGQVPQRTEDYEVPKQNVLSIFNPNDFDREPQQQQQQQPNETKQSTTPVSGAMSFFGSSEGVNATEETISTSQTQPQQESQPMVAPPMFGQSSTPVAAPMFGSSNQMGMFQHPEQQQEIPKQVQPIIEKSPKPPLPPTYNNKESSDMKPVPMPMLFNPMMQQQQQPEDDKNHEAMADDEDEFEPEGISRQISVNSTTSSTFVSAIESDIIDNDIEELLVKNNRFDDQDNQQTYDDNISIPEAPSPISPCNVPVASAVSDFFGGGGIPNNSNNDNNKAADTSMPMMPMMTMPPTTNIPTTTSQRQPSAAQKKREERERKLQERKQERERKLKEKQAKRKQQQQQNSTTASSAMPMFFVPDASQNQQQVGSGPEPMTDTEKVEEKMVSTPNSVDERENIPTSSSVPPSQSFMYNPSSMEQGMSPAPMPMMFNPTTNQQQSTPTENQQSIQTQHDQVSRHQQEPPSPAHSTASMPVFGFPSQVSQPSQLAAPQDNKPTVLPTVKSPQEEKVEIKKEEPKSIKTKEPPKSQPASPSKKGGGWFSGWFSKKETAADDDKDGPIKVADSSLGGQLEAYFDEESKRWIFPGDDVEEARAKAKQASAPPPSGAASVASISSTVASSRERGVSPAPSMASTPGGPPATTGGRRRGVKRGLSRYKTNNSIVSTPPVQNSISGTSNTPNGRSTPQMPTMFMPGAQ